MAIAIVFELALGKICLGHTALCAQTQTKKNFESVASQRFQNFSCGSLSLALPYNSVSLRAMD
ncbi:hypothetical protein PseudUWO310_08485 [Pseudanabaena sp. UWO310]|nr:hypothetical protein PseudUWO310_08485 [Pseudanabaena sp. UWO310]